MPRASYTLGPRPGIKASVAPQSMNVTWKPSNPSQVSIAQSAFDYYTGRGCQVLGADGTPIKSFDPNAGRLTIKVP